MSMFFFVRLGGSMLFCLGLEFMEFDMVFEFC